MSYSWAVSLRASPASGSQVADVALVTLPPMLGNNSSQSNVSVVCDGSHSLATLLAARLDRIAYGEAWTGTGTSAPQLLALRALRGPLRAAITAANSLPDGPELEEPEELVLVLPRRAPMGQAAAASIVAGRRCDGVAVGWCRRRSSAAAAAAPTAALLRAAG